MKITKKTLAQLEGVYSIGAFCIGGETRLLAASENRDCGAFLFSPPDWKKTPIWDGPGGVMNVVQIDGTDRLLAITDFYPIFQSERAAVREVTPDAEPEGHWTMRKVLDVPFVHRIGIVQGADAPYLLCCTLCERKAFQDDWSSPGLLQLSPIPATAGGRDWELKTFATGFTKNHGLYILDRSRALVTAEEGVFSFDFSGYTWGDVIIQRQLSTVPTGDIYLADIDGDGRLEVGTLEPFHGNKFGLYRLTDDTLEPLFEAETDFGHAVWLGRVKGAPAALVAARGGDRELVLYRNDSGDIGNGQWERTVIDTGIGATQIQVFEQGGVMRIIAANHGANEIAEYAIE